MSGFELLGTDNSNQQSFISSVQNISVTMTNLSTNVNINQVNLSRSFIIVSSNSTGGSVATYAVTAKFTSSTTINLSRSNSSSPSSVVINVIQLNYGNVQQIETKLSNNVTSLDVTVSNFDVNKSFIISSSTAVNDIFSLRFLTNIINSNTIRYVQNNYSNSKTIVSFIIDLS